jgi:hypothetical protein
MDDDVVALLALDADSRQLLPNGALDKTGWSKAVNQADAMTGEHWLLTYEAVRRSWLLSPALTGDPVFLAMANAGVGFYDTTQNRPQFPAAAGEDSGGQSRRSLCLNSATRIRVTAAIDPAEIRTTIVELSHAELLTSRGEQLLRLNYGPPVQSSIFSCA